MTDRGRQSWGWSNGTDIYKAMGELREGFGPEQLNHSQAIIHTRHATFGEKVKENSHPFSIKGIIGAHNGIINNHTSFAREHGIDYSVDSEVIFHAIADGVDLSELEGYGAVVFWQDGVFNIGRFNNGEMCLVNTEFGWAFASTERALADAIGMAGLAERVKFQVKLKEGVRYQLIDNRIVRAGKLNIKSASSQRTWQSGTSSYTGTTSGGGGYGYWDAEMKKWVYDKVIETPPYGSVAWYKRWPQSACCKRGDCGCLACSPEAHAQKALPLPAAEPATPAPGEGTVITDDGYSEEEDDRRVASLLRAAMEEHDAREAQQFEDGLEDGECSWCGALIADDDSCFYDDEEVCADCYSAIPDFLLAQEEIDEEEEERQNSRLVQRELSNSYDSVLVNPDDFPVWVQCAECFDYVDDGTKAYQHRVYVKHFLCNTCYWRLYPPNSPLFSAVSAQHATMVH